MKVEDSGMPEEEYWNGLFDIKAIIDWLDLPHEEASVVEIGCGYGTFTIPLAVNSGCQLYAFDIDPVTIATAESNAIDAELSNIHFTLQDVIEEGTGLPERSADLVLLFNLLHSMANRTLLVESARVLKPDGKIAILHWRKDIPTPRGPVQEARPDENVIMSAAKGLRLSQESPSRNLGPYHWGMKLVKDA